MEHVAGFPFLNLNFTKESKVDVTDRQELISATREGAFTDLLVLCHGWNNDIEEARALYEELLGNMRKAIVPGHPAAGRATLVLGVFWHSKRFTDDALRPNAQAEGGVVAADDLGPDEAQLAAGLDALADMVERRDDEALDRAKATLADLEGDPKARKAFVEALRTMLPPPTDGEDEHSERFFTPTPGDDFVASLAEPVSYWQEGGDGGLAAGSADGAGDYDGGTAGADSLWWSMKAGAARLLNYATYYLMKERAGLVGTGLNHVLGEVRTAAPTLRIHLVGHSFGARAVTAAVAGPSRFRPASLALLQGAFSHNGFCADIEGKPGHFRSVMAEARVAGPIIATHTVNDRAVGIAYALASRLANQVTSFGGPEDKYGGIGRNGAMRMHDEAVMARLEDATHAYEGWKAGKIFNLKADRFIADHGAVRGPQVAHAVLTAMTTG